jgi:hypothetical protein
MQVTIVYTFKKVRAGSNKLLAIGTAAFREAENIEAVSEFIQIQGVARTAGTKSY